MRSNKSIEERILEMEEMKISSQVISDLNWDILKKFRKPIDEKTGKYSYYLLIRCRKCGNIQLVGTTSVKRIIPCNKCVLKKCEGEIYGIYKILRYCHSEEHKTSTRVVIKHYYEVQCVKCGKVYIKEKNTSQWSKYSQCNCCNMANPNNSGFSTFYADYKSSAKIRNIDWELSYIDFENLIQRNCVYCGNEPVERVINGRLKIVVNGVDRIDSNKGYTIYNCVPCCSKCNYMKSSNSIEEFLKHVEKIHKYSLNKGSTTIENTSTIDGSELSTPKLVETGGF